MKPFFLFILLSFNFSLWAYTPGKTYKLTILHTNDHHGHFWANQNGELGLAARATLIKEIREEIKKDGGYSLLLDAGDVNTGVPQSDLQDAEPDFRGMNLLGYDVMALGNHEFDKTLDVIQKQEHWAGFPFISANIYHKKNKQRVFPSHIEKTFEDLKITIFGLTTEDTPFKSKYGSRSKIIFKPVVEEAKRIVPHLRKNTDVLIALTHIGHYPNETHGADAPGDVTLARQVPGIDLIVGGHTQKPLFNADIQNGAIIVQAEDWGKYVGRVDLEFLDGKVSLKKYQLIPVNLKSSNVKIKEDSVLLSVLRPYKEKGDATLLIDLGTVDQELVGARDIVRKQETNLGNFLAHVFQQKFKTDIALLNSGGIRASIAPGKITYETVLTVLPFGGEIVTAELNGKELRNYLSQVLLQLTPGSGSFPQLKGVVAKISRAQNKVIELKVNGKRIKDSKRYSIALPEFIALGGDKYPPLKYKKYGFVDADILREYIETVKIIKTSEFHVKNYLYE